MNDISEEAVAEEEEEEEEEEGDPVLSTFVFSESVDGAKSSPKHSKCRAEDQEDISARRWFSENNRLAICRTMLLTQFALDSFNTEII